MNYLLRKCVKLHWFLRFKCELSVVEGSFQIKFLGFVGD